MSRMAPTRVVLASPRGYCAGVDRAVDTVERALDHFGPPVYVRREIVHNRHVVAELTGRGAVFVESEEDVPAGAVLVLSAHGVAPEVHVRSAERKLRVLDATCPLVTKVHAEARRFAERGYTIVLVGHAGHEEVVGTMGEAPDAIRLVESIADVDVLEVPDPMRVAYITQTTLSVDETIEIIAALRRRYPAAVGPKRDDICYATQNRQNAVKRLASEVDLVLVIGSQKFVELKPAGRGDPRVRGLVAPDRRRARHRPRLARRRHDGGNHVGGLGARDAGRPCHQPLPGDGRDPDRHAGCRAGGRALLAPGRPAPRRRLLNIWGLAPNIQRRVRSASRLTSGWECVPSAMILIVCAPLVAKRRVNTTRR